MIILFIGYWCYERQYWGCPQQGKQSLWTSGQVLFLQKHEKESSPNFQIDRCQVGAAEHFKWSFSIGSISITKECLWPQTQSGSRSWAGCGCRGHYYNQHFVKEEFHVIAHYISRIIYVVLRKSTVQRWIYFTRTTISTNDSTTKYHSKEAAFKSITGLHCICIITNITQRI